MDGWITVIVGLFGGAGATLLWELVLKPMHDRRNIAEVLSAEVSINLRFLGAAHFFATSQKIPSDFCLSTTVFDSVVDKVGYLPPDVVGEVVFLYRYFNELNRLPDKYSQYIAELRTAPTEAPHRPQVEKELQACVAVFNSYIDKAITRVNLVQPLLLRNAFPWWSIRRWKHQPSKDLEITDLAQTLEESQLHRTRIAEGIRRRGST